MNSNDLPKFNLNFAFLKISLSLITDYLIVILDGLRKGVMNDEADIRLVDAHAECDRGHDDLRFARDPLRIHIRSDLRIKIRMVMVRGNCVLLPANKIAKIIRK